MSGLPLPRAPPWKRHLALPMLAQRRQGWPVLRALAPHLRDTWVGDTISSIGLRRFADFRLMRASDAHWARMEELDRIERD
jgi:hypothetical protein